MKIKFISGLILVANLAQAQLQPMGITEAKQFLSEPMPPAVEGVLSKTPQEYSFLNTQGENSVVYVGQVMRNVLISDSKAVFASLGYGSMTGKESVARARLSGYYLFNNEDKKSEKILVPMKNEAGEEIRSYEFLYGSLYPKEINLQSKFAGVDNPLRHGQLLGWNSATLGGVEVDANADGKILPSELYEAMIEAVVKNASSTEAYIDAPNGNLPTQMIKKAHVTVDGLDLSQLSQKLLHVAVSFSQAAGDYTSVDLDPAKKKGLLGDNAELLPGRPFTVLQHHWDEAFGYFGAARNYLDYTDEQIRAGVSIDAYRTQRVFDDNKILQYHVQSYGTPDKRYSLSAEKNLGLSENAAKRDMGAVLGNEDFTTNIMSAFLKGRQLVQEKPEGYLEYAQAHAVVAVHEWERLIAATVVHYINETMADMKAYGTGSFNFENLAKHFSEMKGFAFGFQFNPNSVLFEGETPEEKVAQFNKLHVLIGDRPELEPAKVSQYIENLLEARQILTEAYRFDLENAEAW